MKDPFPEDESKKDRGRLINRRASLGSQIVALKEQIPELEKTTRKTPPKTLKQEWEKVEAAKKMLPLLKKRLEDLSLEEKGLGVRLTQTGAYGCH